MTDYHSHNLQLSPNISQYFVSTEKMKWRLTHAEIPEKNVVVSGIPIDPEFYKKKSLDELKIKYSLNGDSKNILILSGGQGLVDIDKIIHSLFESKKSLTIYAGNNEKLKNKLDGASPPLLCTIGWTDKMTNICASVMLFRRIDYNRVYGA
jgi:processive 1,2-diacylglycerol beta-glucosyltransferase